MDIKKIIVICIMAVAVNMVSAMPVVCAEAGGRDPAPASQAGNKIHAGMSKQDLFKIYHIGDIEKYEVSGHKEVFVFDDILTSDPDDTITVFMVRDKVKSWDKNKVIFPTDEGSRSAIHAGMSKKDLLEIYPVGNLKSYERSGNTEAGTFNDILTSDPDDTITFYLVDGKVTKWDKNKVTLPSGGASGSPIYVGMSKEELDKIYPTGDLKVYARSGNTVAETFHDISTSDPGDIITFYLVDGRVNSWDKKREASVADARLIDEAVADARSKARTAADTGSKAESAADARLRAEADADARLRAKADADARLKAKSDFDEIVSKAKADAEAKRQAIEERKRQSASPQNTVYDDLMKTKQQERRTSIRSYEWDYDDHGLHYRHY